MSRNYKIRDSQQLHFVTFTVVNWIDAFTRTVFKDVFLDSIKHCQQHKGLQVYAWVIMTNHAHMILSSQELPLEGIIRDLKSFTSRSIRKILEDENQTFESRRNWMLYEFKKAGYKNSNNNDFQFWQQHSHPIFLYDTRIAFQKLEYIHQNPVKAGFVDRAEAWVYSSAVDYYGEGKGLIDIILIE
jgi:putative transposase